MLSRSDFSTPEWQSLQIAIHGSAEYMSLSQTGLFDEVFEMRIVDKVLENKLRQSSNSFIADLIKYPKEVEMLHSIERSADSIEAVVIQALKDSVTALLTRDPGQLLIFREVILEICEEIASKFDAISSEEASSYDKIKQALKDPEPVEEKLY